MAVYAQPKARVLTGSQVAAVAAAAGFKGEALVIAVAVAKAESGWDAHAVGDIDRGAGGRTVAGAQSTGLWQVHFEPGRDDANSARQPRSNFDPAFNARSAYAISGGGTNFGPWSTFDASAKHPKNNGAYKAHLSAARAAVAAMDGAPISSTTSASGVGAVVVPGRLPDAATMSYDIASLIVGGSVELSTSGASELTLEFLDPEFQLLSGGFFALGHAFNYERIAWTVTVLGCAPSTSADPKLIVRASPSGVVQMRTDVPQGAQGITATDYVRGLATRAGLGFVGQDTGAPGAFAPQMVDDTSPDAVKGAQRSETSWDVTRRLAEDLAQNMPWVAFESGGTFFFGMPQYLANYTRQVELSVGGATRGDKSKLSVDVWDLPTCEATRIQAIGRSQIPRGVRVRAPVRPEQGKVLRPGYRASLAGVPVFTGDYMITSVRWDVTDGDTRPVLVEATDFPSIPGVGPISTIIPAPPDPPVVDPPPAGSQTQQARISNAERIRIFGQPGDTGRYRTYTTPWGIKVRVHDLILPQFKAACEAAHAASRWRPQIIGSYVNRNIAGTNTKSLHSWALAWDFYSTPRYQSDIKGPTFGPDAAFREAFKGMGFYLGAEFRNNADYPHIEWASARPVRRHSDGTPIGGL